MDSRRRLRESCCGLLDVRDTGTGLVRDDRGASASSASVTQKRSLGVVSMRWFARVRRSGYAFSCTESSDPVHAFVQFRSAKPRSFDRGSLNITDAPGVDTGKIEPTRF